MITVETLRVDDRAAWEPLWHGYLEFYETVLSVEITDLTFARLVAGEGMRGALARVEAGRAVGFVHWLPQASTWSRTGYCYLEDLFVAPDLRGRGVGRTLIAHVRDWAAGAGLDQVYWLTHETNTAARGLYDRVAQRSGFLHYEIPLTQH